MKTLLFLLFLSANVALAQNNTQISKGSAMVDQIQGVYIFTDCKPVMEYEYLGTVEVGIFKVENEQYSGVRNGLLNELKKKFPQANGAIMHLAYGQRDKADAILFK